MPKSSIYLAEIPENIPVKIPIPNNAKVIGTIVWDNRRLQVILDVPEKPEDVIEFYRKSLNESGWVEITEFPQHGFVPTLLGYHASFCQGKLGLKLSVIIHERGEEVSDVRIILDNTSTSCRERTRFLTKMRVLPALKAPEGVLCIGLGFGSSSSFEYLIESSKAILKTNMSSKDLEEYYRNQLQEKGWKVKDIITGDEISCSIYDIIDEQGVQWKGILTIQTIDEDTKIAYLMALTH